jgi:hypothetical protein
MRCSISINDIMTTKMRISDKAIVNELGHLVGMNRASAFSLVSQTMIA